MRWTTLLLGFTLGCLPSRGSGEGDEKGLTTDISGTSSSPETVEDEASSPDDDRDPEEAGDDACADYVLDVTACLDAVGWSTEDAPVDLDYFCDEIGYGGLDDLLDCHLDVFVDVECTSESAVNAWLDDLRATCT